MRLRRPLLAALLMAALASGAAAQSRLPGPLQRLAPDFGQPAPEPEIVTPSLSIELAPGTRPEAGSADEPVAVTAVRLAGNQAIATEALAPLWQDLVGKTVPLGAVYAVATRITERYAALGYFLSFAYLPAQSVADGTVRIEVQEGYVDRLRITGVEGRLADTVRRLFDRALAERPARLATVERALLLAGDLAGLTVSGVLHPEPGQPGATELTVTVTRAPVAGSAAIDTRGTKYAGPSRAYGSFALQSPLGLGELVRLDGLTTTSTHEQRFEGLDVRLPIGTDGLRFDLSAGYGETAPGYTARAFDVRGRTSLLDAGLGYPVVRSLGFSLLATLAYHANNARTTVLGAEDYADRSRSLGLGAVVDWNGLLGGATRVATELRQGLRAFGANRVHDALASRPAANPAAVRLLSELLHLQPLGGPWSALVHVEGQYAFSPLLVGDQYAVGGSRFGRAYDVGEITGDQGLAGSLELRYELGPVLAERLRPQLYAFYDIGAVWQRPPSSGGLSTRQSTGAGLRAEAAYGTSGFIEYAKPIRDAPQTDAPSRDGRVYVGVALRF